jgi:diguanylate cyclase (GGDEF)-like protein
MNDEKKRKILIVDDEKANLDVLVHILRDNYTVYPAKSGEAALRKTLDISPDLVLLDIIMPEMNGFDVLERLKKDSQTAHIPVIFITGLTNAEDEKKGLLLGAADYITKPFSKEVVLARVATQMQIVRQQRTIEELGMIDEMTGVPNRNSFDRQLNIEWSRAIREKSAVSFLMIELDGLVNYAKEHGRGSAESLLREAAELVTESLKRRTDIATRYGGSVFAVILPSTGEDGALTVAAQIKKSAQNLKHAEGITFNVGVSSAEPAPGDEISCFVLNAKRQLKNPPS